MSVYAHVLLDASKMPMALEIQLAEFSARYSARYLDAKGEAQEFPNLPKRECLILVSGYSVEMRAPATPRDWRSARVGGARPSIGNFSSQHDHVEVKLMVFATSKS